MPGSSLGYAGQHELKMQSRAPETSGGHQGEARSPPPSQVAGNDGGAAPNLPDTKQPGSETRDAFRPEPLEAYDYAAAQRLTPPRYFFEPKYQFPHDSLAPRRLRSPKVLPPSDGAGLLGGTKWHGKPTPYLGKGRPPVTQEEEPRLGKRMLDNSHIFKSVTDRDVLGQNDFKGLPEDPLVFGRRPMNTAFEAAERKGYRLVGGRVEYGANFDDSDRKARGRGVPTRASRVATAARTMGQMEAMSPKDVDPDLEMRFGKAHVPEKPRDLAGDVVRYRYSALADKYGRWDPTRDAERADYERRVGEKQFAATSLHSEYYYKLNRARAQAASTAFTDPLYTRRPATAGPY
ncbi:unnamed protein product [Pedinophyceae sp. YPF-701]|nr:unnamed protein product [Pedinophyceae sp. YPF-701]